MKTLYLIPARGGSKGIPKKNIKDLNGKPLIYYTIDVARTLAEDFDICVSTDCDEIISIVQDYKLDVPFKRPEFLACDQSGSYEVIMHAIEYFNKKGRDYDNVMLLQPTSPFRQEQHLKDISALYNEKLDMVVSVNLSHQNPYFNLFEENEFGFLEKSKKGHFESRQQSPPIYAYNGSVYLLNTKSLRLNPLHKFEKIKKYVMDDIYSMDIDTPLDWAICETIIREGYIKK
ncbi:acylneuraminate cytidylyltransferase family protein [Pedobacter sp. ASV1-7]|uniref:acylneuraminate cytidylyltransferase family protein n=1 Tax=Pedobacter sp. ASV1-7 TaxID=3145237 RepID=UPI0032E8DC02